VFYRPDEQFNTTEKVSDDLYGDLVGTHQVNHQDIHQVNRQDRIAELIECCSMPRDEMRQFNTTEKCPMSYLMSQ